MKIAIIGGGSLGLLFSYYLSAKHEVYLYTRSMEQAELINSEGVVMIKAGKEQAAEGVSAAAIESWQGTEQLTIIAMKQYQLAQLMPVLKEKARGCLLFLQNGFSHVPLLKNLSAEGIYVGSVEHGAVKANGHTVYHNGDGITRTALFQGDTKVLNEFSASMNSVFPIVIESDYHEMLIRKLVVNAAINPLTAVLKVKNGELISNPYYRSILDIVFEECAQILELHNKQEYLQNLLHVCEKTANNHSSMFKDLENGRRTEIDAILGYLLEEAERKKIPAPLLYNYFQCIKGKEREREDV